MDEKKKDLVLEVEVHVVEVEHHPDCPAYEGNSSTGPAMVNSDKFRMGHDRIFGKKPTVGQA